MSKRFLRKRYFFLILTLLLAIEIFWFSSLPGDATRGGNAWIPRIYHFTVFFLLNFFLLASIKPGKRLRFKYVMLALILSVIYALSDEFHQMFVPLRSANLPDVLTDTAGILFSIVVSSIFVKKVKKK